MHPEYAVDYILWFFSINYEITVLYPVHDLDEVGSIFSKLSNTLKPPLGRSRIALDQLNIMHRKGRRGWKDICETK